MNHERFEELINTYIDSGLSDIDSASVFAHLSTCPSCRELLAGALRVRAQLSREKLAEVPVALDARIARSIRAARGVAPDRTTQHRAMWGGRRLPGLITGLAGMRVPFPLVAILLVVVIAGTLIFTTWSGPEKQPAQFQEQIVYVPRLPAIQVIGFYTPDQKPAR